MFCMKCGKEIPEGAGFCPSCGAKVNGNNGDSIREETSNSGIDRKRIEIVCPKCGSNQVKKLGNTKKSIPFLGVGILFIIWGFLDVAITGHGGFMVFLGILSAIFGGIMYLGERNELSSRDPNKWYIQCETCNEVFPIDIPNGTSVITNLTENKDK